MNRIFIILLVLLGLQQEVFCQSNDLPFTIELEEITYDAWPGMHSFSFAEWDDYWVFAGGRRNGLHGFFTVTGFPESEANDKLWVMNPENGDVWNFSVMDFPNEWKDFLRGTNPQFVQKGKYLYILGGYGKDIVSGAFVTFDQLLAIDLSILIPKIIAGISPIDAFRSIKDARFKVCGGEMHELEDYLYLVGGHNFNGLYNQLGNPTFTQEYTSEIRKFKIVDDGEFLTIEDYSAVQNPEFHRRDLSLSQAITSEGEFALAVFGGVFKPNADEAYLNPIYITEQSIEIDSSYEQKMSQYTCPVIPLYDAINQIQYHLFFGGISLHFWDEATQTLQEDPLMPFIDEITTFVRYADGSSEEQVLSVKFDELLGSNAKFIRAKDLPIYANEVAKYDTLSGRTLLGYIYGGIRAAKPNITSSSASNRLFEVYIDPILVCEKDVVTSITRNLQTPDSVLAENNIQSTDTIATIADVTYQAGNSITLNSNFQTKTGSIFKAIISNDPCGNGSSPVNAVATKTSFTILDISKTEDIQAINMGIFPNPFTTSTTIQFTLSKATFVQLNLMDSNGKQVQTIIPNAHHNAGYYQVKLQKRLLQPGTYFLNLTTSEERILKKVVVVE